MPVRVGTCNRCGQCCGAEGSPHQRNPWPSRWPNSFRTWQLADLIAVWPQALLFGITDKAGGTIEPRTAYGSALIRGDGTPQRYYWVWVEGHAVCKDTSQGHEGTSYSLECPFLRPDSGDGLRPCGLVGTEQDHAFRVACESQPPKRKTADAVMRWKARHPLCGYTWIKG